MSSFEDASRPCRPTIDRAGRLASIRFDRDRIGQLTRLIYDETLRSSPYIRQANFERISSLDLKFLFDLYDRLFFDAFLGEAAREECDGRLKFRVSMRMTKAAGQTTRIGLNRPNLAISATVSIEIAVSGELLFRAFRHHGRPVVVCGRSCADRLEALQRVFEHELIHLAEFLVWRSSNCSASNYQDIVARIFAHEDVRHEMATPREIAAEVHGLHVGDTVSFEFEGRILVGRLNRITKRGSILVEDPKGAPYSNGKRYLTYYVALPLLKKLG